MIRRLCLFTLALATAACGSDDPDPCAFPGFDSGGDGHASPLGSAPGEARAGRIAGGELPDTTLGMAVWSDGDFVLANDRVALVIEDVGPSDLYDPWGGRPVGVARIENGALVDAADFGEFFVLTGRHTVVTQEVTVLSDGSDGGPAIVRASGFLSPMPFFDAVTSALIRDDLDGIFAAIDYVLLPDSDHVDIRTTYFSSDPNGENVSLILHGFMYGKRMPIMAPVTGFGADSEQAEYLGFIDSDATSYSYEVVGEELGAGIAQSGFSSNITSGFDIGGCETTTRDHARMVIGGVGLDGLRQAIARTRGEALRTIAGEVLDSAGVPAVGVRVHATLAGGDYLTRSALTSADGTFEISVPADADVELFGFRRGENIAGPFAVVASATTADVTLEPSGEVRVVATDSVTGEGLPARVQVLPLAPMLAPEIPTSFGEQPIVPGRLAVEFPPSGDTAIRLPVGSWEIVVSRGYDYELHRETVTIAPGGQVQVDAELNRSVDSSGLLCADYHIHTVRSADGVRTAQEMAASGIADGLEIMVRSDHEFIADFEPAIAELGLGDLAFGVASIEMTSLEIWGHMNVFPLESNPSEINHGAPTWQRFPTAANPETEFETLNPVDVMASVRDRPEGSRLVINHPIGANNYFGFSGLDLDTGVPGMPDVWDETFTTIEAFNGSSFRENEDRSVRAWFGLLASGRPTFVVGASDAHGLDGQGTGYPRTCLQLDLPPRSLTSDLVAEATFSGRSSVVGGILVDATVEGAGPGATQATGLTTNVDVVIQAPTWVDVDSFDVIVDGQVVTTINILPGDADPNNPAIRYSQAVPITVAGTRNWVVVAAHGDAPLEPVTIGALPFGVTNPIFLER